MLKHTLGSHAESSPFGGSLQKIARGATPGETSAVDPGFTLQAHRVRGPRPTRMAGPAVTRPAGGEGRSDRTTPLWTARPCTTLERLTRGRPGARTTKLPAGALAGPSGWC